MDSLLPQFASPLPRGSGGLIPVNPEEWAEVLARSNEPKAPEPIETDAEREARWRRDIHSDDVYTSALAERCLKNLAAARREEIADYIEGLDDRLATLLDPYLRKIKIKSPRTEAEYKSDYDRFVKFWRDNADLHVEMPVAPGLVAAYVMFSAEEGTSYSALSRMVTAIDHGHAVQDHPAPSRNVIVRASLQYAKALKNAKAEAN